MTDATNFAAAGIPGLEYDPAGNRLLFNGEIIALGGAIMPDTTIPAAGGIPGLEYDPIARELRFNGVKVGTGSGPSATITVTATTVSSTSILVTRSEPTSGTLATWSLEYRKIGDSAWISYATGLTGLTQTVADLDANASTDDPPAPNYEFRALPHIIVDGPYATATGATDVAPPAPTGWVIQRSTTIAAQLGNGMLTVPGTVPLNGAIPPQGRTLGSRLIMHQPSMSYGVKVYGVRFRLGNMRQVPISGGRMIGGWTTPQGAGPNNVIGTDYMAGYVRLAIGGDINLPIPAAPVGGLMTRCTDILRFPGGVEWRGGTYAYRSFDWRFFQPENTDATDYAMTWYSWGTTQVEKNSTLCGAETALQNITTGYNKFSLAQTDGNLVDSPAAAGTWTSSPPETAPWIFGPPGPEASPIIEVEWFTEEVPA